MGKRHTSVGHDQQKNEETEDSIGRHVQESRRMTMVMNSQRPLRMEYTHATPVKATSQGRSHLVTKKLELSLVPQGCRYPHGINQVYILFTYYSDRGRDFSLIQSIQNSGYRGHSQELKQSRHEGDHLSPSRAEIKLREIVPPLPLCLHGVVFNQGVGRKFTLFLSSFRAQYVLENLLFLRIILKP